MTSSDDLPARDAMIEKLRSRLDQLQHTAGDRPTPVTTLTYAQSIDGCIAPFGGGTMQLSGAESQKLTHQIRALHDTILVGINTVLCDDPRLTVRLVQGKNPQPVVVDSRLRFPLEARLLKDPCVRPIIATSQDACPDKANRLLDAGAQVIRVPSQADGLIDLWGLLIQLRQMGFHSVMVEGGAKIITSMLASQMVDQLLLAIALKFVGGLPAVNPTRAWDQMPQLSHVHCQLLKGDLIVWGHLEKHTNCGGGPIPSAAAIASAKTTKKNGGKKVL